MIDIQQELDDIAREQGYSTDEIVSTVNENESLLKQMQVRSTDRATQYIYWDTLDYNLQFYLFRRITCEKLL